MTLHTFPIARILPIQTTNRTSNIIHLLHSPLFGSGPDQISPYLWDLLLTLRDLGLIWTGPALCLCLSKNR